MRPRYLLRQPQDGSELNDVEAVDALQRILPVRKKVGNATLMMSLATPYLELPAIDGCVVGTLFSRDGRTSRTQIAPADQLAIMSTNGRALVERASGSYVAFWRSSGDGPLVALRDPSACLPAFLLDDGKQTVIASDIECLNLSGAGATAIDAGGVAQYLRFPLVPSARTCLLDVQELRPGFSTTFGRERHSDCVWHPRRFACVPQLEIERISSAIDAVVDGQCARADHIAIELSGGLDSSILAASISRLHHATALHLVPSAADGDERRYARIVTDRFGMDVHETSVDYHDVEPLAGLARQTARPSGFGHFRAIDRKFRAAQQATGVDIVFSGTGGDSVFGSLSSTAPVIDAWLDGGFTLARTTLADIATIREVTLWEAARSLLRRVLRGTDWRWDWPPNDSLLGPAGRAAEAPDTSQLAGLRPGARAYFASVLRMQALLDAHDRMADGDIRFPLMAQPVIEACLAVPSWRWMTGGRDRAPAREAFAGRVPDEILQRRGKGRYDTLIVRAYEEARAGLGELLLDGWLAQNRLIDSDAVARVLAKPTDNRSPTYSRVIAIAETELWCRAIVGR